MELRMSEKVRMVFLIVSVLTISFVHGEQDNSTRTEEEDSPSQFEVDDSAEASNHDKRSYTYESYPKHYPKHPKGYGHSDYQKHSEKSYGNNYKGEGHAKPHKEVQTKVYEAITFHNFNESYHCGVIPDTNFELYQSHSSGYGNKGVYDVAPFGKFPWTALITYKNKYTCTGVLIQSQHVLTSASCVPEYHSLSKYRVRVGDWDLLTNYNEYEAYRNLDYEICGRYPVGKDEDYYNRYHSSPYGYGGKGHSDDLVLLRISDDINYDKRPHVKPICLPSNYDKSYGQGYGQSDSKEDYGYKGYKEETHCWVVGWYGSKTSNLKNHPQPSKQDDYKDQYSQKYYQHYSRGYDKSFIQKRAKVKEIKCPASSYYKGSNYKSDSVCFVGVEGYDSCVADRGAAIFCVIPEKNSYHYGGGSGSYDSGYTKSKDYYGATSPTRYQLLEEDYEAEILYSQKHSYGSYGKPYQKDIKAHPTQPKSPRYRAVLYAIVQKPRKCRKKSLYKDYSKQQSRPIRASKVDYQVVRSIISTFWETAEDKTCPVPKASYRPPNSYYHYSKSYSFGNKRKPYQSYPNLRSYFGF